MSEKIKPEQVCNKLHNLVNELYESFYTEQGKLSKGKTEPCLMFEEIAYYCKKQVAIMTEERPASNS